MSLEDKERRQLLKEVSEDLNTLLLQFEALIHKTMSRLNIPQNNMFYEDFTQELALELIEIYQTFEGEPLVSDIDRYKFTAYAGRGLYWQGLNLLRQNKLDTFYATDEEEIDWLQEQGEDAAETFTTSIYIEDFLKQAQARLSAEDYQLLLHLMEGKYTMQELAELMNVSRDTIYQRRQKMQGRLRDLKECLIH